MSIEQKFAPTITNEQTAALPAVRFEGEVQIVDTEQALIEACEYLSQHSVIGFDTETRPSFKAGVTNRVALIQLSTSERCYLIRLCRMKFGRELQRLLENPNIKKVGADVAGDIRSLTQLRHIRAAGFIDLQTIAPQWGIEEKSLRKLSAIVLGKRVSKAQRLSNWEAAQFTEQQISYAATDAWVCLEILAALEATPKVKPAPVEEVAVEIKVEPSQTEPSEPKKTKEAKGKSRRRPFRRRKPHPKKQTETKE
ncbi:MAG: 3'-5' exonuclease domain-containing protein 2 [Rikenellaceae bacterium]|jgi:ribonuclease D|nr:3'-5' exonuclease domain-containing protein 2 [Rikenellaceae bacterium]MBQ5371224.1 3'-5' exonuclease domain-containing protein 2 [Rikenellaceae bacterium]